MTSRRLKVKKHYEPVHFHPIQNAFRFHNRIFCEGFVRDSNGFWIFWVYFLGSEDEANGFNGTITVRDTNHSKEEYQYKGQVVSIDVKVPDIVNNQRGLVLTDEMVRRLVDENSCIEWTIRLNVKDVKPKLFQENTRALMTHL